MEISKNWSILKEKGCFTLLHSKETDRINKKTNKNIIKNKKFYYGNMKDALNGYVIHSLDNDHQTLNEILKQLNDIKEWLSTQKF